MPAITITDLNNAKTDVDHIAALATSTLATATDRFGVVKPTLKGAIDTIKAFNSRGAWVTGTAYVVKDLALVAGTWYAAVTAHTASAAFATDAANWRVHQGVVAADLADTADPLKGIAQLGRSIQFVASMAAIRLLSKTTPSKHVFGTGHATAGDGGGGIYYLDATDTTTADDNGSVVVGVDGGRWKLLNRSVLSLKQFGGDGSGVADSATAFEKAAAVVGSEIKLEKGSIFKIATPKTIATNLRVTGDGTLLFTTANQTGLLCQGTVYTEDVILDGNNSTNFLINCTGSRLVMKGGAVKKVFLPAPTDNVTGIQTNNTDYVRIENVDFSEICGPANATIGDTIGAVAAIQIIGSCADGLVEGCGFTDVNNRATAGGVRQFEDADAIRCFSVGGDQNVTVKTNRFGNIGKRAAKFSGTVGSRYKFDDNDITSPYLLTVDDAVTLDNGMFSIVSCYSGYFSANKNRMIGGVVSAFFEGGTTLLRSVQLNNNVHIPEYHKRATTSATTFARIATGVHVDLVLGVSENLIKNVYYAVSSFALTNIINGNPLLETAGVTIYNQAGGVLILNDNLIKQSANGNATTEVAYAVLLSNALLTLMSSGNTIVGKYDGFNIFTQSAAYRAVITDNIFSGIVRTDIGGAGLNPLYVTANNQSDNAALKLVYEQVATQTTVGAAGGGTALPATPLGYKREFVNGVEVASPYYARV